MPPLALTARRALVDGELRPDVVVVIDGGVITDVTDHVPAGAVHQHHDGATLMPGMVDLHSDCLEDLMAPRPTATLDPEDGLVHLDTLVASHGVTTNYICVGLLKHEGEGRTVQNAARILRALAELKPHLRVDHRVHLRVDVVMPVVDLAEPLFDLHPIDMVSYMDHTPGQGQYPDIERWRTQIVGFLPPGVGPDDVLEEHRRAGTDPEANRGRVAELALRRGAVLAAHDDDTVERVEQAKGFGAQISEFPVTAEALKAAIATDELGTVMGAPNARRGVSHSGNLSAREAIAMGGLDALASDYHPPSMLGAAQSLHRADVCGEAEALALVTSGPARIAGITDRGLIAPGRRADLVVVTETPTGQPVVRQTIAAGRAAFGPGS